MNLTRLFSLEFNHKFTSCVIMSNCCWISNLCNQDVFSSVLVELKYRMELIWQRRFCKEFFLNFSLRFLWYVIKWYGFHLVFVQYTAAIRFFKHGSWNNRQAILQAFKYSLKTHTRANHTASYKPSDLLHYIYYIHNYNKTVDVENLCIHPYLPVMWQQITTSL